ncbi:MAG TPA: SlyX family protein [Xanthobacteraceae bacterium]|nr:SlyX family protein [Xanthobacteraceae bacterium]
MSAPGRNDTPDDPDSRIDLLEIRIAFQDRTIEELNQSLTAQWAQIDILKRTVEMLTERLQQAESRATAAPEPPPPHY